MCYVCNCFTWTLDLIQRAITFCLTCCITCVICFGLIITAVAGVAYGYNYSFAEFITHTRSDVTIYMRRGQFYDHPDIAPPLNRRMGDEDDLFGSNNTSEYEERVLPNTDSEPLSEKFLKDQDTKEYALKLTKYKNNARIHSIAPEQKEEQKMKIKASTLPSTRRLSKIPIVIPTTVWLSDNSPIILRKFLPLNDVSGGSHTKKQDDDFYKDNDEKYIMKPSEIEYSEKQVENIEPDIKIRFDDIPTRKIRPIINSATKSSNDEDDFVEEESENNAMYKPV